MVRDVLSFISLQYFLVSWERKVWFVILLALLISALYINYTREIEYYLAREALLLLIVYLVATVFATIARFFVVTAYRRRSKLKPGEHDNVVRGTDATANMVVFLITAGSIFPIFGIPFSAFLTSLGLIAVGLAIVLKGYLQNFIDGFRLLYSRDFLIGDYVKTKNGSKGVITDISYRATKVKTEEGDVAFVPNTVLMSGESVNFSKAQKSIVVPLSVDAKKLTNLKEFEDFITARLQRKFPRLKKPDKLGFVVSNLSGDTLEYVVEINMEKYSFARENTLKDEIYRAVFDFTRGEQSESLFNSNTDSDTHKG